MIFERGEKVSKVLNECFKNDKLNTMFSDIIAKTSNRIKGKLQISIDPIDYMLMSCNKSGWTSCHTIHKFGEGVSYGMYSSGLFSYMCDEVSLVAFRYDGNIYDFDFNGQKVKTYSKNWRQMIYLNSDTFSTFICSKQYPNANEEIARTVREMLEEQINSYIENTENWVHSTNNTDMCNIMRNVTDLHYNDITHGRNGEMCYIKGSTPPSKSIRIGAYPICPSCRYSFD